MPKTFSKRVESQRPDLKELCPELIKYVGDIKFKKHEIQIQELSLEFGETIFDHGEFKFPNLSSTKTFSFGLVLEHGFEVFLEGEDLSPFHLHTPGDIFLIDEVRGLRHILPQEELNMTAGARSIALSAKINDSRCFERLVKHFRLEQDSPKMLRDEWDILRQIAHNADSDWRARALIISIDQEVFASERCYMLRHFLRQSFNPYQILFQDQLRFDLVMSNFMDKTGIKIQTSILEHIKHFYFISAGYLPGFVFASDNLFGPMDLFKQAFIEIYGLQYAPGIVQPGHPRLDQTCYYPLHNTEHLPLQQNRMTSLTKLKEIKKSLNFFQNYLKVTQKNVERKIFGNKEINYFHHQPDSLDTIYPNAELSKYDSSIRNDLMTAKLPFCESNPIFKAGCIAIKNRQADSL